jgi:hypothetical protein
MLDSSMGFWRRFFSLFTAPHRSISDSPHRLWSLLSPGLALVISFAVAVLCMPGMGVNSDVLVPEMMFRDLFVLHTPLDGWNFSSALFLFPDWGFYFLSRMLSSNLSWVFLSYATAQMWMLYWIIRLIRPAHALVLFLLWTVLLIAIFPVEWMVFLWPVCHGGSMLAGLFFAQWYLQRPALENWVTAIFVVVGALALASDLFFGLQTLLPLGILSLTRWRSREQSSTHLAKQVALGLVVVLLAFGASKAIFGLMHSKPLDFSTIHFQFHWEKALDIGRYLLGYKFGLLVFIYAFWRAWKDRQELPFYSWLMLSLACTLAAVLAADIWLNQLTVRYFLFFPILVCLVLSSQILKFLFSDKPVLRALGMGLLLSACLCTSSPIRAYINDWPRVEIFQPPHPSEVVCFDKWQAQFGLKDGIASFWLAKTIPLLSHSHPNLFPMRDEPREFKWLNNSRWYDGVESRNYVLYDVHDGRPNREMLLQRWGPPIEKYRCGTIEEKWGPPYFADPEGAFELWLYDRNLNDGLK